MTAASLRGRLLLGCTVLLAVTSGCGLTERRARADGFTAAMDRLQARDHIVATVHASLRPASAGVPITDTVAPPTSPDSPWASTAGPPTVAAPTGAPTGLAVLAGSDAPRPVDLRLVIDRSARRVSISTGSAPLAVFEDERVLVRRPEAAADEARPWLDLRLADVRGGDTAFDPDDFGAGAVAGLLSVLDPRLLLDIVASPLSGSVRSVSVDAPLGDRIAAVDVANVDVDKALDDRRRRSYPADRRERVRRVLDLLSLHRTVNRSQLWVVGDDVARIVLALEVKPSRYGVSHLEVTIDVDLRPAAVSPITVPDARQTVRVESLAALQRSGAQVTAVPGG